MHQYRNPTSITKVSLSPPRLISILTDGKGLYWTYYCLHFCPCWRRWRFRHINHLNRSKKLWGCLALIDFPRVHKMLTWPGTRRFWNVSVDRRVRDVPLCRRPPLDREIPALPLPWKQTLERWYRIVSRVLHEGYSLGPGKAALPRIVQVERV